MRSLSLCVILWGWCFDFSGAVGEPEFTLKLNNSGPAVVFSDIIFSAYLIPKDRKPVNAPVLKYTWTYPTFGDFKDTKTTYGVNSSSFQLNELEVVPYTYNMDVAVYKKINASDLRWDDNEEEIASGKMKYTITENLNGVLKTFQKRDVISPPQYYATGVNVTFNVSVSDRFRNVSWLYMWKIGDDNRITTSPNITMNLTQAGSLNVHVKVIAMIKTGWIIFKEVNKTIELKETIVLKACSFAQYSLINANLQRRTHIINPFGVADIVGRLTYTGDWQVVQGCHLAGNITCVGSPPFNISWQVQDGAHKLQASGSSIQPQCNLHFDGGLVTGDTDIYTLWMSVQNDVSMKGSILILRVVAPPIGFGIPFLCSLICLAVLLTLMLLHRRDHASAPVEVANFHFGHHASTESQAWTLWEKLKAMVASVTASLTPTTRDPRDWFRHQHRVSRSESTRTQFERSESYGSLTSVII